MNTLRNHPAAAQLAALSQHIDQHNRHRSPETIAWGRISKVAEEHGETVAAFIGATGQNPRKGLTHTMQDVIEESLDTALTALGNVEHFTGNNGLALELLAGKIDRVVARAGIPAIESGRAA